VFHILNDRVINFIDNCIFFDQDIDFLVICNDKSKEMQLNELLPSHVKTLYRDNKGFDFGGWSDGLLLNNLYKKYQKFVFINSSVIGPFLPPNFKGRWTDCYLDNLKHNVKLFGSTINCIHDALIDAHVQSYVFALEIPALEYLIECGIFTNTVYQNNLIDVVMKQEIGMSRKIIEKGWNIGSLMNIYKDIDFRFIDKSPHEYNIQFYGDLMYNQYRNILWKDDEVIFIKGNRINIELEPSIST
jgi:lipopolysaccharide biosynthesis protein